MPGGGPANDPPGSNGIWNNGFGLQPSITGGGVAACIGELADGRGEGAVWMEPSGELLSILAGGRMFSGDPLT